MSNIEHSKKQTLSFDDAVITFILRMEGIRREVIAQRLGTSPDRVNEVLLGDAHPKAAREASTLLFA
ncbi:MAG: hypothetical protein COB08_000765 [Rhodobacteraceae bacterium]|nr:hypothetical protein [Paracoccaceae bacterium]